MNWETTDIHLKLHLKKIANLSKPNRKKKKKLYKNNNKNHKEGTCRSNMKYEIPLTFSKSKPWHPKQSQ